MPAQAICPTCQGSGTALNGKLTCPVCKGAGVVPSGEGFPVPFHYVFPPFTIDAGGGGDSEQIADAADFDELYVLGQVIQGDPRFVRLQLEDEGSNFNFSNKPVGFDLFCGSAKLPFTIVEPYTLAHRSRLSVKGSLLSVPDQSLVIGVGDGVTVAFTSVLEGPVLPGSVIVTDPPGVISGTDAATPGAIAGTGIVGTISYNGDPDEGATDSNGRGMARISVTFAAAPAAGAQITVKWTLGIPQAVVEVALAGFYKLGKQGSGAITTPNEGVQAAA